MDKHWHANLLIRLDNLVSFAADRGGLALDPDGRLADEEARLLADTLELGRPSEPGRRELAAVELLRALAEAIGLLRDRGDRVQATTLRHPWARLDAVLRAGLVYAAWCHRVPWVALLGDSQPEIAQRVRDARGTVLRLLWGLPEGIDIDLGSLAVDIANRLALPDGTDQVLLRVIAAVFLDPLVALGMATVDPPSPEAPTRACLHALAHEVIGSALIAAGDGTTR